MRKIILALFIAFSVNGDLFGQQNEKSIWVKNKKGVWEMKKDSNSTAKSENTLPAAETGKCYKKCLPAGSKNLDDAKWEQVICPFTMTETYMNNVTKALKNRGYTVGSGSHLNEEDKDRDSLDEITNAALANFQIDNKISKGGLTTETAKLLDLPLE